MEKSSTSKFQKIIIWFIIIAMTVGSIGAYFVVIIANENQKRDTEKQAELQKEQQKQAAEEAKKTKQPLDGYSAEAFDKAAVKKLKVETLQAGNGKTAKKNSQITANYFGWTSDGVIFDSTKKDDTLTPVPFSLNGVIAGWKEGLTGVKAGSVVKLSIPASKAYGDSPPSGYPAGPLMFIIQVQSVQ